MRYRALACDYDGTIAHNGKVDDATVAALEKARESGRRLILVTGRTLPDLRDVFSRFDLFDILVVENGAVLYKPDGPEEMVLGDPPASVFVDELRKRRIEPLSQGRVIVATWEPHETLILALIREFGLELQVIFNKGAVMVLPSGINKATGLEAALTELKLSPHNTVGVGDAENDHAFLALCGCGVCVANALPVLKEQVDFVTLSDRGAGVAELVEKLIGSDLRDCESWTRRPMVVLGSRPDGSEISVTPLRESLIVTGASGSGKSTLARGIVESLSAHQFQFCIVDPEGDYEGLDNTVMLGNAEREPSLDEVCGVLERPEENVVINLLNVAIESRAEFFSRILDRLAQLYRETGRPHQLILDEAHHLVPASAQPEQAIDEHCQSLLLITVHPEHVANPVLRLISVVAAVGKEPQQAIRAFAEAAGAEMPEMPDDGANGAALFWRRGEKQVHGFHIAPPRSERKRHQRKYAEGTLGDDRCFYFTGPDGKMHLKAQNLMVFLQLAEGVDDETWLYHLKRGDYSRWVRECIKDDPLASEVERIERSPAPPDETRAQMRAEIGARYTAPA
jgi:hypothetical protein